MPSITIKSKSPTRQAQGAINAMSSNVREDEAVRDLRKALKHLRPKRRHSVPSLRHRDDLLDPEIGYALKDVAQPGGFRREFAQKHNKEPAQGLVAAMEQTMPADIIAALASDNKLPKCKSCSDVHPPGKLGKGSKVPGALPALKKEMINLGTLKGLLLDNHWNFATKPFLPLQEDEPIVWTRRQTALLWYVLMVSVPTYANKTLGASFLPVVLQKEFGLGLMQIGMVTATYPLAAFLSVPLVNAVTQRITRPFYYHAATLFSMAFFTWAFLESYKINLVAMVITRSAVGISSVFYFSASTALIIRSYDQVRQVPAIVGYVEGAFGVGGMLGRIIGGTLYSIGGFELPYYFEMFTLIACASGGLLFLGEDTSLPTSLQPLSTPLLRAQSAPHETRPAGITSVLSWPIVYILSGVFLSLLPSGFFDAFLAVRLNEILGPTPPSTLALLLSALPFGYISGSIFCSHVLAQRHCTPLYLMQAGSVCLATGLLLSAPVITIGYPIVYVVIGLSVSAFGMASTMVPTLPSMHERMHTLREKDACGTLCIGAVSMGEAIGPIALGAVAELAGFQISSILIAAVLTGWCVLGYSILHKKMGRGPTKANFVDQSRLVSLYPVYAHLWIVASQYENADIWGDVV